MDDVTAGEGFSVIRNEEDVEVAGVYTVDDDLETVWLNSGDEKLIIGNESRDLLWRFSRLDIFRRILSVDDDIVEATGELPSLLLSFCFVSGNQRW